MKNLVWILLTVLVSSNATAACFQFINGNGPRQLGNSPLPATATKICIQKVNRFGGGSYSSVTLSDEEGDLAIVSATEVAQGRCASFCKSLTLSSGNINGQNVDLTGVSLIITTQVQASIGTSTGFVEITAGRDFPQKYLILGSQ